MLLALMQKKIVLVMLHGVMFSAFTYLLCSGITGEKATAKA